MAKKRVTFAAFSLLILLCIIQAFVAASYAFPASGGLGYGMGIAAGESASGPQQRAFEVAGAEDPSVGAVSSMSQYQGNASHNGYVVATRPALPILLWTYHYGGQN
ncbi:MAG: hypothetical protein RAK25_06905, partial [TACK group archaeon]|nr:hypothetical protein [TACK group archaeon]